MTGNEPVQEMTRILCIEAMLDPLSKTIQDTAPEFLEHMIDMNSVFEFEFLVQLLREYMLFHTIYQFLIFRAVKSKCLTNTSNMLALRNGER